MTDDEKDAEAFADSESRKKYSHTIYAAALDGFKEGRVSCSCRKNTNDDEKDAIEASKAHYEGRLAELSKFGGFANNLTKNINLDFIAGFLAGRKGRVEPKDRDK